MAPRNVVDYEVEHILQARISQGRKSKRKEIKYLVKWVGFGKDRNSWEPEKNFEKFDGDMIDQFWEKVDLGGRSKVSLIRSDKAGETFTPSGPPPSSKKRKADEDADEEPRKTPAKARKGDKKKKEADPAEEAD